MPKMLQISIQESYTVIHLDIRVCKSYVNPNNKVPYVELSRTDHAGMTEFEYVMLSW